MKKLFTKIVPGLFLLLVFLLMRTDNAWAEEPTPNYLTFTAEVDNSSVTLNIKSGSEIMYSINKGVWESYTLDTSIALNQNDNVRFKGKSVTTDYDRHFSMTGKIAASGSVTSLTDGNGGTSNVQLSENCYEYMFCGCSSLTRAPELNATELAELCYNNMFCGCSSLTRAPELTATELKESCYAYMFCGCSSLTRAPEINTTELAEGCYHSMFFGCSSLASAPKLPATTLAESCYAYMFYDCSSLTSAPELNATKLAPFCYGDMFFNCSSLTRAPKLPATELKESCYAYMFCGCSSLTRAPELPATELKENCYRCMFAGCSSLTRTPELPATELKESCYECMFCGCRSLTSVPKLPATTLAPYCYNSMFCDCPKLKIATEKIENEGIVREITIPAYDAEGTCDIMFGNAGTETSVPEDLRVPSTPPMSGATYYTLPNTYSISYVLNGGTQATGNPTEYIEGEGIQSFKSPTRSGYTFMGWFADAAFTKEVKKISAEAKGDITIYAKWLKNPYTEKITVKNVTYQISFDSYDNALSVVLTKFSDKKATSVNIGKFKYNGKSYSVTEIGDNAFKNNKKLKTVTIGSSVKTIGKSAFSGCTALTSVKSGSKVTEIKASAFNGCKKLKSITLASGLEAIGSSAFTNCKALTKVTIGSKVNSIGSKAFKGCSALKSVTIKTTLLTDKNVGKEAFSGINSKATVKVPAKKLKDYTKLLKKKGIKGKNQKIKK